MHLHTEFNIEDGVKHSRESGLNCKDKSLAQQQFKDECNINILFARYLESGEMPQVLDGLSYGNFEGIFDYQTAMNATRTAEGLFQQFPARIKNRFDNDPQKMLEFLADENNREEAEFLGLLNKEKTDEPGSPKTTDSSTKGAEGSGGTGKPPKTTETTEKP